MASNIVYNYKYSFYVRENVYAFRTCFWKNLRCKSAILKTLCNIITKHAILLTYITITVEHGLGQFCIQRSIVRMLNLQKIILSLVILYFTCKHAFHRKTYFCLCKFLWRFDMLHAHVNKT